ncbi:MAG: protein translocase subunit SecD [Patescibacteria group bacterium]|nr:protein translocase subunit SecD [Patescibacteria group bacterium]
MRYFSVIILIVAALLAFFVWHEQTVQGPFAFKLGLDLSGGTELEYTADTSNVPASQVADSLSALQAVIERRVNAFGVGEPVVETERGGLLGEGDYRLVVELPGVTNVTQAETMIGQTPTLAFELVKHGYESNLTTASGTPNPAAFATTGLTGTYLTGASLQFGNGQGALGSEPVVEVNFDSQGAQLFSQITTQNVGSELAIFLDGQLLSAPVIQTPITNGTAIISGNFSAETAKELATNLNLGALPVPITLSTTETIGATLGSQAVSAGILAALIGFIALSIFMVLWYRLPGIVAVVALLIYVVLMLTLFALIPVVLTAAGIAGFILSVGLAVDANILIAERVKEELRAGKEAEQAIREGFTRAWSAIRDSNIAHIIAAVILFWIGTDVIKGFALVFGLGVIVSMLSAISISRTFLLALGIKAKDGMGRFFMGSGFSN